MLIEFQEQGIKYSLISNCEEFQIREYKILRISKTQIKMLTDSQNSNFKSQSKMLIILLKNTYLRYWKRKKILKKHIPVIFVFIFENIIFSFNR